MLTTLTDKSGEHFLHLAVPWWGVIVGYIIGLFIMSVGGRYVGMFLMASGYTGKHAVHNDCLKMLIAFRFHIDASMGFERYPSAAGQAICQHRHCQRFWEYGNPVCILSFTSMSLKPARWPSSSSFLGSGLTLGRRSGAPIITSP